MSYAKTRRHYPAGIGAAGHLGALDISDADGTTEFTWTPVEDCMIYGFGGTVTEATGTQSTTAGVCSLVVGSTEKSTFTAGISKGIGTEARGSSFVPFKVAAGTAVLFKVKTQAVGGTIVGEYAAYLELEMFPALEGA